MLRRSPGKNRNAGGEAQVWKPGRNGTTDGRSLRAGKQQAGITTSQGQQRESGSRRDDRRRPWLDHGKGGFSDSASLANKNLGGASLPRPLPALSSEFGNRRGEPAESVSRRWSRRSRLTCGDGSGTSTTVKRPRCCKALNLGYAADSGRWCGSSGSADERDSENFATGE
jgi:hypothetical protein